MPVDAAQLEADIRHLSGLDRPSASPGERAAAEWVAAAFRAAGAEADIEEERAHGGYWWPVGLLNAAGAAAGLASLRGLTVSDKRMVLGRGRPGTVWEWQQPAA